MMQQIQGVALERVKLLPFSKICSKRWKNDPEFAFISKDALLKLKKFTIKNRLGCFEWF